MAQSVDQSLADAVRGDKDALTTLLMQYGPQVRGRLAGKIPVRWQSMLDDDDVMQVTYLEAFVRINGFRPAAGDPAGSFLAWLTRSAENNLRDALKWLERKKRPQPAGGTGRAEDDAQQSLIETLTAGSTTPSRRAGRDELCVIVAAALRELPADYAEVVRLYDLAGALAGPAHRPRQHPHHPHRSRAHHLVRMQHVRPRRHHHVERPAALRTLRRPRAEARVGTAGHRGSGTARVARAVPVAPTAARLKRNGRGDTSCDGSATYADINPFVRALSPGGPHSQRDGRVTSAGLY